MRILRVLSRHASIVTLMDLVPPVNPLKFSKLSVVFEYMPSDLKRVFRSKQYFTNLQIEYILYQILLGVKCIHDAAIIHRNLKPDNILIDQYCTIKISDFGLARGISEKIETKEKNNPVSENLFVLDFPSAVHGYIRQISLKLQLKVPKDLCDICLKFVNPR